MKRTIQEAHRWASSFLQQHSKETAGEARLMAEVIVRHMLGWDRARFFANVKDAFPENRWPELQRLVREKSQGVPLQHLLGSQEFFGRPFHVSADVLIPRPETEGLVEAVLTEAAATWGKLPCSVVDVGTGSGAIAVTLAAECPTWHLTAIDLSAAALKTARQNAERHGVDSRIRFLNGDLLQPLLRGEERVDIVVSNPPYIPQREIEALAVEVKDHEPRLALDGGEDGVAVYRRLATMLPAVMKADQGLVAVEVGRGQSSQVANILHGALERGEVKVIPDLAGIERVVLIHW